MFGLIVFNAGLAMYSFCKLAGIPMLSSYIILADVEVFSDILL
jgi:hypothetical protein